MSSLGRYLEFSLRTPDIIESLGFYKLLGFTELEIGDVWPHKYAVVTDGVLCIGLHDAHFDEPSVTLIVTSGIVSPMPSFSAMFAPFHTLPVSFYVIRL